MFQNILLTSLKYEHPGPTYYLFWANIYGLDIHNDSNSIYYVYTWTDFEVKKGMNNIASCLIRCFNDKWYYYQSYSKNNKMPTIAILVENWVGKNKNNITNLFLNMFKEGGLFRTATLDLYIKGHTKNDCDRLFNSLKVLYWKQNVFTFE